MSTPELIGRFAAEMEAAAAAGDVAACRPLVRLGVHKYAATLDGRTPLHCAARHGRVAALLLLLNASHKAEEDLVSRDDYFQTPLHAAATCDGREDDAAAAVRLLLARGADSAALDINGHSPRRLAFHDEVRKLLPDTDTP